MLVLLAVGGTAIMRLEHFFEGERCRSHLVAAAPNCIFHTLEGWFAVLTKLKSAAIVF